MIRFSSLLIILALVLLIPDIATAQSVDIGPEETSGVIRTAVLLTVLAIIPSLFITMTCFMRIAIVLSMVRHAFGMPETPPNPVIISLSIFLTFFVMAPVFNQINHSSLQPFLDGSVSVEEAVEQGAGPLKDYMLSQVKDSDIVLMYNLAEVELPDEPEDVSLVYLTPAFILNELRVAFTIGFIILLPFLLIDLVVSSILLSLGMMMVPPATISLPIKLLMFVVIDGWALVIEGLIGGIL